MENLQFDPQTEINTSLVVCTLPNGNKTVNIKKGKRRDRVLIASAEKLGVDTYDIPADEQDAKK
jgi:hypothetical protein